MRDRPPRGTLDHRPESFLAVGRDAFGEMASVATWKAARLDLEPRVSL
jgi:hypothetical protein